MGKKDTEEKILVATLKLVSEKGYLGATTREIAAQAGVTEVTLFRHFGSKEKLFEEMLKRYTFLPRLKELLPQVERLPYDQALMMIGTQFLETLKERKALVVIMLSEINLYPEKIRIIYNRFINELIHALSGYFVELQNKSSLRGFAPEAGARAFLGMLFSYFKAEEIIRGRNLSREEIKKTLGEFVQIFILGTLKQ